MQEPRDYFLRFLRLLPLRFGLPFISVTGMIISLLLLSLDFSPLPPRGRSGA